MRTMEIPPFPRKFENSDLTSVFRTRLSQTVVLWPDQALPLAGYLAWPNEPSQREVMQSILRGWANGSKTTPKKLGQIQQEWARVADVFHLYSDLIDGEHQKHRGGPSIGKAIELAEANTKSRGTGHAKLWEAWSKYKDVAHLVTAAVVICADARIRYRAGSLGQLALTSNQLQPFRFIMLMPDLVLAVALEIERKGLSHIPKGGNDPTLNPETLWRIPADINVVPLPLPTRKIRVEDLVVLHERRAGNRGVAYRETALMCSSGADAVGPSQVSGLVPEHH
jgi:hypothetical protein